MITNKFTYYEENLIESKILAIKQVYRNWGVILRKALRELSPVDRNQLRSSLIFRVDSPRKKADITGMVRLFVGVLNKNSPALRYLKFITHGVASHYVPVKTKGGRYTGILGWAQRHNLVYFGKTGPKSKEGYRWRNGVNKGKLFYGLKAENVANDMFTKVYTKYHAEIVNDVNRILRGE